MVTAIKKSNQKQIRECRYKWRITFDYFCWCRRFKQQYTIDISIITSCWQCSIDSKSFFTLKPWWNVCFRLNWWNPVQFQEEMSTSAGIYKTLLATFVERMNSEFEFSQKMEQSEKRFKSWRYGVSFTKWCTTKSMVTWTHYQHDCWIRWLSACLECASQRNGVEKFNPQVGSTRMWWLNW